MKPFELWKPILTSAFAMVLYVVTPSSEAQGADDLEPGSRKLLRIVETELQPRITGALDQQRADLEAAGWTVEDVPWSKRDVNDPLSHIRLAQHVIWPRVLAASGLHVFLIGQLPMPYSGLMINPDGHGDTTGAYACTAYYGCPSTGWTDAGNNTGAALMAQHLNVPGDGKFDQQSMPGSVRACVGFLDLSFARAQDWGSALNKAEFEAQCVSNYFQRVHDYRGGAWRPTTLVGAGHYQGDGNATLRQFAIATVGETNYATFQNSLNIEDLTPFGFDYDFKAITHEATFWSARTKPWAVLDTYWGSYQIDFGSARLDNPLMGGALATGSIGYSWDYSYIFEGRTLGQVWNRSFLPYGYNTHRVLYGDPTVAIHPTGNRHPVANAQSASAVGDAPVGIHLSGSDADGDPLSYAYDTPAHGTLSGTAPDITYTPAAGYCGPDRLNFAVSDGRLTSPTATVSIAVLPLGANTPPTINSMPDQTTAEDITAQPLWFTPTDAETATSNLIVTASSSNPVLLSSDRWNWWSDGTPRILNMTPAANQSGTATVTVSVTDGSLTSNVTFVLTVTPVNDAPLVSIASPDRGAVFTAPATITIRAGLADADGTNATVEFFEGSTKLGEDVTEPYSCRWTGSAAGNYALTAVATDGGGAASTSAVVSVTVNAGMSNQAPVAQSRSLTALRNTATNIVLTATDAEGDPLTYGIAANPTHGTLSGTPPNVTYMPATNYLGSDGFTFTATDGQTTSAPATVSIMVTAGSAEAFLVVDWGGDYVTANQNSPRTVTSESQTANYGGSALTNDARRYIPFSDTDPFSPSAAYSGTSSNFYGGWNSIVYDVALSGTKPQSQVGIVNGATADTIRFRGGNGTGEAAGVAVWRKEDFLSGSDLKLVLNATCALRINIADTGGASGVHRLVVKNGPDYYVSGASGSLPGWFTVSDPTAETWAAFNPANADNRLTDIGTVYSTRTFDDVQAIGYYWSAGVSGAITLSPQVQDAEFMAAPFVRAPKGTAIVVR